MASGDGNFTAEDIFGFGSHTGLNAVGSSDNSPRDYAQSSDENGNVDCESDAFNIRTEVSQEYSVCRDLVSWPTTLQLGNVVNGYVILGINLGFTNTGLPVLTVSGHGHAENNHAAGDVRKVAVTLPLPTSRGNGIPAISGVTASGTSVLTSATFDYTCQHTDAQDENGDQWDGQNFGGICNLSLAGNGTANDFTIASPWTLDDPADTSSNTAQGTFTISAHEHLAMAV